MFKTIALILSLSSAACLDVDVTGAAGLGESYTCEVVFTCEGHYSVHDSEPCLEPGSAQAESQQLEAECEATAECASAWTCRAVCRSHKVPEFCDLDDGE